MGKKKGRQSGGFASKSMRAAFAAEVKSHAQEVPRRPFSGKSRSNSSSATTKTTITSIGEAQRPKLLLHQLQGLLQERQMYDRLADRVARRRRQNLSNAMIQGIGNNSIGAAARPSEAQGSFHNLKRNPPGWILNYKSNNTNTEEHEIRRRRSVPSLQSQCIRVLGPAMPEYLDALGRQGLHGIMSMFPSWTLEALSIRISSTAGMTDGLACVVGKHDFVEKLCLCNHPDTMVTQHEDLEEGTLTGWGDYVSDKGLSQLIPRLVSSTTTYDPQNNEEEEPTVLDSWEQVEDSQDTVEMAGCIRLQRFELVNAYTISTETLSLLLSKCSCITHFSLSGSLSWNVGHDIMPQLFSLLPNLQVLDVSFCSWVTEALLRSFWATFLHHKSQHGTDRSPCGVPVVCVIGCASLSDSARQDLLYEFPGSLITTNGAGSVSNT